MSEPHAHPSAFRLEAVSAGADDPEALAHAADCERCRGYLAALRAEQATLLARTPPEDFARAIRQRAEAPPQGRRWLWAPAVALGLAATALLLFVGQPPASLQPGAGGGATPTTPQVRLKGAPPSTTADGPTVAAIVLRDGLQRRHVTPVDLLPGDRLRVELTVPIAEPLTIGLYDETGRTWIALAEDTAYEPGAHVLSSTFEVDARPMTARIVVGSPAAVTHAIDSGDFSQVVTLPLLSRGRP